MIVVRTVVELREHLRHARHGGATIGFVPTMGAFHEGHLSLVRRAREQCGFVVVSLFVNPAQFNEKKDLERYPRDEQRDLALAEEAGAHLLFAPSVAEIYPAGFATAVEVSGLVEPLEGGVRGAGHFRGVTTVVAKLFNMVQPDRAFFGQKDAQQALIIRRMTTDLDLPIAIEVCPTVREADGLAMSSRNVLLDAESRRRAPALSRALHAIKQAADGGETNVSRALGAGRSILDADAIQVEYLSAVSTSTLQPVDRFDGETLVAIAARFGAVRLIDNVLINSERPSE
jgi:pantoate--beta-alanine ligase